LPRCPVFNIHSNSNEEYSQCSSTPSCQPQEGLRVEGATARQVAPPLKTTRNPTATPNLFRGAF
jgi:hypothetical protein